MHKILAFLRLRRHFGLFILVSLVVMESVSCGGGSSQPDPSGVLNGNWQIFLTQQYPRPTFQNPLSASGFLTQSGSSVTGSIQVPASAQNGKCAGVAGLSGTVSGQNVALTMNNGGNEINLTGTIATSGASNDGTSTSGTLGPSIAGSYSGAGGGCFTTPTSGTWTALLIPPLSGTFTGTITDSNYMATLNGGTASPIGVTGTLTQTGGPGSSNAMITGTIQASGYPCFRSASLTGTISGQNVYLLVFGFSGDQIGTVGIPPAPGAAGAPATVTATANGTSLVAAAPVGLLLGAGGIGSAFGPCPPLQTANGPLPNDSATLTLTLSGASNFHQRAQ